MSDRSGAWKPEAASRKRFPRRVSYLLLLPAALSIGCDRSSAEQFARTLEQGVSLASAATYAAQLRARGAVPDAYVHQLTHTAAANLQQIQTQVAKAKDVSENERIRAASILMQEQRAFAGDLPDVRVLPDVQRELSALARQVRSR